jgi:hypothetical protein
MTTKPLEYILFFHYRCKIPFLVFMHYLMCKLIYTSFATKRLPTQTLYYIPSLFFALLQHSRTERTTVVDDLLESSLEWLKLLLGVFDHIGGVLDELWRS